MDRKECFAAGAVVLLGSIFAMTDWAAMPEDANPRTDGFVSVFNGRDLSGWTGKTNLYTVENGVLYATEKSHGNMVLARPYTNFVLRFDFQLTAGANNGAMLRLATPDDWNIEIQILDNDAPQYKTLHKYQYHGSLYGVCPAKRGFLKPTGEWNHEEIRAEDSRITTILNGTKIMECDLANVKETMDGGKHPHLHNPSGYVGFMAHNSRVGFKNIFIKGLK